MPSNILEKMQRQNQLNDAVIRTINAFVKENGKLDDDDVMSMVDLWIKRLPSDMIMMKLFSILHNKVNH